MKDRFVIFDLDGTLCDSAHRNHLAQSKDWHAFHMACPDDPVIQPLADLMAWLGVLHPVVLLTGRNEAYRELTVQWLERAGLAGRYDALLMRADHNYTKDHEMKIAHLERFFGSREAVLEKVWLVIDDRDTVVEGLRNYGLTVLQPCSAGY